MINEAVKAYLSSIGKKGGSKTSPAKAKSSRENGKKPKLKKVIEKVLLFVAGLF